MSDQRSAEVAAASLPPPDHPAINNADEHVNASAVSTSSDQEQAQQATNPGQALTPDTHSDDHGSPTTITASRSERDVEAVTAVQDRAEQHTAASGAATNAAAAFSPSSPQVAGVPAKKFTSLNVNKRFLEKAGPTTPVVSPTTLKLGSSVSPRPSHRLSSPSATSRLTSAKLSSVPKSQPAGWATTKPATPTTRPAPVSQPAAAAAAAASPIPSAATDTPPATAATSPDPLPAAASAPLPKAAQSPKPANAPAIQVSNGPAAPAATAATASPRLVSMGRDSPRPTSAGLESGSGQGRASPGLRNAALGTSFRAASPASVSRAPWAGVKSGLSPNPTPAARGRTLSDFPTAAEAARAQQEQEEKAAAAAAREAARQQAALQALDRFRGTSLGSGKHWDEMEDEDGGFLGEVVEFGDGSQYKIPTSGDGAGGSNGSEGPPVSKEDRFKDVSHDRSWPQRDSARPAGAAPTDRPRPTAGQPAAWGPLRNREGASGPPTEGVQTPVRTSRSEQRPEKVIIPTTGASVSLRSPVESRDATSYSYGRDRRSGAGQGPYGARQDHSGPPSSTQAASTQAARAWGPLAQRQASLNPGAAPPASAPSKPSPPIESGLTSAAAATLAAPEPVRAVAPLPSMKPHQSAPQPPPQEQQRIPPTPRERTAAPANEPSASGVGQPNVNGRPLPPHLLVSGPAGSTEARAAAQSNRPLPPHLAQNLRPAAAAPSSDTVGRKTSHAIDEAWRPNAPVAVPPPASVRRTSLGTEQTGTQPQSAPSAQLAREDVPTRALWGSRAAAEAKTSTMANASGSQIPTAGKPSIPLLSSGPEEDVHASIERARKRREEEERARLAEKERARQKALAIEERIRAAQQQKEAEAQRAAQKQAVDRASAAAAAAEASSNRKPGPADSATSWRSARTDNGPARSPRSQIPATPKDQLANDANAASAEQSRNSRVGAAPRERPLNDERLPSQRELREQRTAQGREEVRQRGPNPPAPAERTRPRHLDNAVRTEEAVAKANEVGMPKTILTRPAESTTAPLSVDARDRETASARAAETLPRPQKNTSLSAERVSNKADPTPKSKEPTTRERAPRTSAPTAVKAAVPVPAPAPVPLYPIIPKEAVETKQEVAQDAPPAWNRFVVHLKGSRTRPKLNRYQQKQLFARIAAMKAPSRPVYPLTWDPPLAHLSIKTLSRDDQLFPKRYHRGIVITPVRLPSRVLPRGLPSIVPQMLSQSAGAGSRKQARFDLTAQWPSSHGLSGLGNGSAVEAQASNLSAGSQIQVRLPGHHATVVQPSAGGPISESVQAPQPAANRRSHHVDPTTDAIIGEVLSSGASQPTFEDRSRAFHGAAAPGSLGPLDYPQNGYTTAAFGQHNPVGGYRSKGRRGSTAAVAFFDDRRVSTPSPVSFMVNSEIKADTAGSRASLSPFGIPGSTRASQTQTPASGGSMLPSPSLSTQGTWGQSSLTFPVLETRSSNLADRDHIKSVWSLATNSHSGELQNSLKDIGDDFLPSTMPMSVHDFRADEGHLAGAQEGDRWAPSTFNRFQYGRSQHEIQSSSRDLSPVTNRSNGFDPTSRSPSLGMDASAAARTREAGQHHHSMPQHSSNAYSSINGGAYGHHQGSSYSPRERQQDGGSGLTQSPFGAYGGYTGSASNNVSSIGTDGLYGMSNYGGGAVTPNRQSYNHYGSHASAARSAPGSPYSGMSRHTSNLTSGLSGYSLFPNSGSGASGGNVASRSSQASNGMEGLGVLDDGVSASFGSGRSQFYGARGYQQQPSASSYSASHHQNQPSSTGHASSGSGKWPASTASPSNSNSSVLRPAASVFNPQKYSSGQQQRASPSHAQSHGQQSSRLNQHQHHASPLDNHPSSTSTTTGPMDRETAPYSATTHGDNNGASGYPAHAYSGFSSNSALW